MGTPDTPGPGPRPLPPEHPDLPTDSPGFGGQGSKSPPARWAQIFSFPRRLRCRFSIPPAPWALVFPLFPRRPRCRIAFFGPHWVQLCGVVVVWSNPGIARCTLCRGPGPGVPLRIPKSSSPNGHTHFTPGPAPPPVSRTCSPPCGALVWLEVEAIFAAGQLQPVPFSRAHMTRSYCRPEVPCALLVPERAARPQRTPASQTSGAATTVSEQGLRRPAALPPTGRQRAARGHNALPAGAVGICGVQPGG
eukprot:gene22951-biopygen23776